NGQLVAEDIAKQLENRTTSRRAMRGAMTKTMKMGALGIKTTLSGRIGGREIASHDTFYEGTVPLQTLRADICYGFAEANTPAGKLGIKVWIYRGEVFSRKEGDRKDPPRPPREPRRDDRNRGDRPPRGDRPGERSPRRNDNRNDRPRNDRRPDNRGERRPAPAAAAPAVQSEA
ncbi:MAG: 30S ribosomal protein S3, partial [Defluviitaleaceae bacterium]|nr:30S ribosomal protein S3 [Defluviitaleaceae bacterium]